MDLYKFLTFGLNRFGCRDLSFNPGLSGSISPRLGDLQKLTILYDLMQTHEPSYFMLWCFESFILIDIRCAGFWPDAVLPTTFLVN